MGLTLADQPTLADGCAGPFDPAFGLDRLSRRALAVLGREWLLHGHLQDRAGMPLFLAGASPAEMEQLAIDEWMLASPIYSRRMQRALNFEGHGVGTIFKNIQLDIGAPHQFMDFRYAVADDEHGEFWLAHCGALMDVEPMGDDFVVGMCHHIEDPTFDATAAATNPHAQVRPIHRPPRTPANRHPHCHWQVTVVPDGPSAQPHPKLPLMESTPIAQVPLAPTRVPSDGGEDDYSGPLDPDFVLEDLSAPALVVALQEFAVQAHLLGRAYVLSLSDRIGDAAALRMGHRVMIGQAGLTAQRLAAAARLPRDDAVQSIATLLQIHPLFYPRTYLDLRVAPVGEWRVRVALGPGWATDRPDPYGWLTCLDDHGPDPLAVIAQAIDPRARARSVEPVGDERRAYEIDIDPSATPAADPDEVLLVKISTGAAFELRPPDLSRP